MQPIDHSLQCWLGLDSSILQLLLPPSPLLSDPCSLPQTPNLSVNQKNTSVNAFCIQQPTMCLVKGDGFLFPRVLLTFLKKVFGDFKGKGHNVVHFYCEWWYHWKVDSLPSTYLMHLYERFVRLI